METKHCNMHVQPLTLYQLLTIDCERFEPMGPSFTKWMQHIQNKVKIMLDSIVVTVDDDKSIIFDNEPPMSRELGKLMCQFICN